MAPPPPPLLMARPLKEIFLRLPLLMPGNGPFTIIPVFFLRHLLDAADYFEDRADYLHHEAKDIRDALIAKKNAPPPNLGRKHTSLSQR